MKKLWNLFAKCLFLKNQVVYCYQTPLSCLGLYILTKTSILRRCKEPLNNIPLARSDFLHSLYAIFLGVSPLELCLLYPSNVLFSKLLTQLSWQLVSEPCQFPFKNKWKHQNYYHMSMTVVFGKFHQHIVTRYYLFLLQTPVYISQYIYGFYRYECRHFTSTYSDSTSRGSSCG